MATKAGRPVPSGEKTTAMRVAGPQPSTAATQAVLPDTDNKKYMRDMNVSVGTNHSNDYKPTKTSGIKIRGTGCATKGVMARGPMG